MSVLVTAHGFDAPPQALEVPEDAEAAAVDLSPLALAVRFPSFADGRGLSLARRLRRRGYAGRLIARGPLLPDQLSDLLDSGFDGVEVDENHLARTTREAWRADLARAVPPWRRRTLSVA